MCRYKSHGLFITLAIHCNVPDCTETIYKIVFVSSNHIHSNPIESIPTTMFRYGLYQLSQSVEHFTMLCLQLQTTSTQHIKYSLKLTF